MCGIASFECRGGGPDLASVEGPGAAGDVPGYDHLYFAVCVSPAPSVLTSFYLHL